MKLQEMIAAVQAELGVQVDGKAGPETWTAIHNALVRAKPAKRGAHSLEITNARGGYSNHNFGLAFDVGVFEGNKYLGDSPIA